MQGRLAGRVFGGTVVEKDPSDAAEEAVDRDRLLDGEDPATRRLEDATHWVSVYGELLAFKEEVLARIEQLAASMQAEAAREVEQTDRPVLRAEARRLRRRLEFWRARALELGG
jgi:hypothetical protein